MSLYVGLQKRAAEGRPLRVGLIGAGKFGAMYLAQVPKTPGIHLLAIADLSPASAMVNLQRVGWAPERFAAQSLDHREFAAQHPTARHCYVLRPDAQNEGVSDIYTVCARRHDYSRPAREGDTDSSWLDCGRLDIDEIHLRIADESGDKLIAGMMIKFEGSADLFDTSVAQHDDLVRKRHRLDLIVGHIDHRGAQTLV